jgi:hypothetical protein
MLDLKSIAAESVSFSLAKRVFDLVFSTLVLLLAFPNARHRGRRPTHVQGSRTMRVGKMEERRDAGRSGDPRRTQFGALLRCLDETPTRSTLICVLTTQCGRPLKSMAAPSVSFIHGHQEAVGAQYSLSRAERFLHCFAELREPGAKKNAAFCEVWGAHR